MSHKRKKTKPPKRTILFLLAQDVIFKEADAEIRCSLETFRVALKESDADLVVIDTKHYGIMLLATSGQWKFLISHSYPKDSSIHSYIRALTDPLKGTHRTVISS